MDESLNVVNQVKETAALAAENEHSSSSSSKAEDLLLLDLVFECFTFTAFNSADKFSKKQQFLGLKVGRICFQ